MAKERAYKKTEPDRGYDVLRDAALNKSTAFSRQEREALGLRGLLPHGICPQETQQRRVLENLRRKTSDIEKYIYLMSLQDRNERLFYATVLGNIEEIMPLIYTPTVGEACMQYGHIFRKPRGFYITPDDKGAIREMLDNWLEEDVRIVVITDGQRILGLGDLGANGIAIPIGKLALYVACAGIHPHQCLPVMFDVGTNNKELLDDPLYLGYRQPRCARAEYDQLMEEFVEAIKDKYPRAIIQFEDFDATNALRLLSTYRDRVPCFNDDIQGTAAVVLAGIIASTRITRIPFKELRIVCLGAGSATTGIGHLIASALQAEGLSKQEAYRRLWIFDSKGLVVAKRADLQEYKLPFAHDHDPCSLIEAIEKVHPHVLIGAAGKPGTFTRDVIEMMAKINDAPTIFALSNPTSRSECTAAQAYEWSEGRAIFASGSPFAAVSIKDRHLVSGQANNAYVFPGVGLGAIAAGAKGITHEMFSVAAQMLASQVHGEDLGRGTLYPPLANIRFLSLKIASAVAKKAFEAGAATEPEPRDVERYIAEMMFDPAY